ncbi:MAG: D-alanyl-D-alanine carboxypeptidase [Candidatus Eisenbacteria bacterium]|nr:D-alanyl-D-alanine carboxypeptidase [Candidatus Latescibacterota bacterium]MBD3303321.1 D-alanyl-D-alanine carboxypeptidase [Candidatus Eisenbacteria bacterium]
MTGPALRPTGASLALALVVASFWAGPACGQEHRAIWRSPTFQAAVVVDAETGSVLYERNAREPRAPASLVKMMVQLLAIEALRVGEIGLEDEVVVPREACRVGGSKIYLWAGEKMSVRDLLYAVVVPSANDAATALAIHIAGSTESFVERMNRRAKELGMHQTTYVNVHGLDTSARPPTRTTAFDQAILARALVRDPAALALSSTRTTTIRSGQTIRSTNRLLGRFPGLDGLKTGFTSAAGFCLAATAERRGIRLISVVLGSSSSEKRFNETKNLLYEAFLQWQRIPIVAEGEDLGETVRVIGGHGDRMRLLAERDLEILIPTRRRDDLRVTVTAPASVRAPIGEGDEIGSVRVLLGDSLIAECAAVAARSVPRAESEEPSDPDPTP